MSAILGCALAIICYRRFSSGSFAIAVLVGLIAANVWWIIGGYIVDLNKSFLALEVVPSSLGVGSSIGHAYN